MLSNCCNCKNCDTDECRTNIKYCELHGEHNHTTKANYSKKSSHVAVRGWKKEFARVELMSVKDYVFRNHPEIICNGCAKNMKTTENNCYLIQYSDDEEEWKIDDVYCFDCTEKYFNKAKKVEDLGLE